MVDARVALNPVSYWLDRPLGQPRPAALALASRIAAEAGLPPAQARGLPEDRGEGGLVTEPTIIEAQALRHPSAPSYRLRGSPELCGRVSSSLRDLLGVVEERSRTAFACGLARSIARKTPGASWRTISVACISRSKLAGRHAARHRLHPHQDLGDEMGQTLDQRHLAVMRVGRGHDDVEPRAHGAGSRDPPDAAAADRADRDLQAADAVAGALRTEERMRADDLDMLWKPARSIRAGSILTEPTSSTIVPARRCGRSSAIAVDEPVDRDGKDDDVAGGDARRCRRARGPCRSCRSGGAHGSNTTSGRCGWRCLAISRPKAPKPMMPIEEMDFRWIGIALVLGGPRCRVTA